MKRADAQPIEVSPNDVRRLSITRSTRDPSDRAIARAVRQERETTTRWLHDRTLQMLEYLAMGGYGLADPEDLRDLARAAADDLRGFIDGECAIDDADLAAALAEVVCAGQLIAGPLSIQLVPGPVESAPDPEQVADLAAGAQEALSNVIRHAGASSATVSYGVTAGRAWVEVADDGTGFDPSAVRLGRGLRHSVMARMVQAGGCARLQAGELGAGTVVHLQVPARRWHAEAVCA